MKTKRTYIPIAIFLIIGLVLEYLSISLGNYSGSILFIFYLYVSWLLWTNKFSFIVLVLFTLLLEAIGLAWGMPFGQYQYGEKVAIPALFSVPLFIPLAWFILITSTAQITFKWYQAALLIVLIDIILEIFAVTTGLWTWPEHTGLLTAPLQNYLTWGVVAACGYFLIPKHSKLKPVSYSILSMLITYMIMVLLVYKLK